MATPERPWSVVVRLDEVGETGRHVELDASEETRAALAEAAAVDAVERLHATFDLTRRGRGGLRVSGRVNGTVRQSCVVTLEPITNEIDEAVDVEFVPMRETADTSIEDEIVLTQSSDEREPLIDGTVDLGALATEFLILGIDPYPRKPGVAFQAPKPASDPSGRPFAALAALQKKGTVKE